MNGCARCGASWPVEAGPNARACGKCDPSTCGDCNEPDDRSCSCWQQFADMPFADVKATFAGMGLSVDTPNDG